MSNIRETTAEKHRAPAPRFLAESAGEAWAGNETWAVECERANLTEFQAAAVLELILGGDEVSFAKRYAVDGRTAKMTMQKAAGRMESRLGFSEAQSTYWRDMLFCQRNSIGRSGVRPLVGLQPWVDTENLDLKELRKTVRDPKNNRMVPLRGKTITEHDLSVRGGVALLQEVLG